MFRIFQVTTLALLMCVGGSAMAADAVKDSTHDGKVVSITNDTLVMTASQDGKEHSHRFGRDATLTLDGKACKAVDLKAGTRIRVTTRGADQKVATQIEGIDKNPEFAASNCHDGKVVSIRGNSLVMTGALDNAEHTCTLASNAKVTCDGTVCKPADLRAGMRVRVTNDNAAPHAAILVEAIDQNDEFAIAPVHHFNLK